MSKASRPAQSTTWSRPGDERHLQEPGEPAVRARSTTGEGVPRSARSKGTGPICGSTPPTSRSVAAAASSPSRSSSRSASTPTAGAKFWAWRSALREAEPIWTEFLRKLTRRGLRGVKLVISDAHEGIKAAVTKVLCATWQRCRVHFMRNVLAHAGKSGRRVASAFIATAFAQESAEAASSQWRAVADQIRPQGPQARHDHGRGRERCAGLHDLPQGASRPDLHSTNPIERVNARDQAAIRGGRDLPQRRGHHPPRRRDPARTKRRVGRPKVQIHDTGIRRTVER